MEIFKTYIVKLEEKDSDGKISVPRNCFIGETVNPEDAIDIAKNAIDRSKNNRDILRIVIEFGPQSEMRR